MASGEPLSFTQDSVEHRGHSIEVPDQRGERGQGLPAVARDRSRKLRVPSGPGVRWDGGYEEGDTISQFYDNLAREARRVGTGP